MLRRKSFILLCIFSFLSIGISSAFADDASQTTIFYDLTPQSVEHDDADPFKGSFTLTVTNDTDEAWGDFHFRLFGVTDPRSQVFFLDGACSWGPGGSCNPTLTGGGHSLDSWTISQDVNSEWKILDLYYYSNPIATGETVAFKVFTDNTVNKKRFGVEYYPTAAPEPISSTLFLLGGATLGIRRFIKKRAS